MKHIKHILVLFLIINIFASCDKDDDVSYVFDDISAPTNVNAHFDISTEEVGLVTVTPTADGASEFEVYFGDGDDDAPTVIRPGETVSNVYTEGEYNLRIVAIGLTGLTSELVRVVTISLEAPEDLMIDVAVSGTNPFEVSVTPTATNAAVFDVFFGESEDEEPTTIMVGETATFEYAEVGDYTIRVVARGAGAATAEVTEVVTITGASNAVSLPITFDDATVNYNFETFNGASFEVVDNPDVSGANANANKVGAITNSGNNFEGGVFSLGTPVDFSGENKTITMKFWSEVSVPVLLKFEGGDERQTEVVATHGGTGWEDLTFNFATDAIRSFVDGAGDNGQPFVPTGEYSALVLFVDGPGTTAGTFYIDNVMFEGGAGGGTDPVVATTLPIDFESNQTLSGVFEDSQGVTGMPIANPDPSGINTSATVYEFNKADGAAWYSGIFQIFPQDMDVSSQQTFSFKIWSPKAGINVRMALEKEGDGSATVVLDQRLNEANTWVTLVYDFSDLIVPGASLDKIVIFPDFDEANMPAADGSVYYIDDIVQSSETGGGNTPTGGKTRLPITFETPENGGSTTWTVFEAETPPLEVIDNPDASGINTTSKVAKFTAPFPGADYAGAKTELEQPFTLNATNSTVKIMVWKSVISDVGIKFEANFASTGEIKIANTKVNEWEEITFDFSDKIGEASSVNIDAIVVFPDFNARSQDNVVYFDNITLSSQSNGSTGGNTAPSSAAPAPTTPEANVISMFSDAYTNVAVDTWRTEWSSGQLEDITLGGNAVKKYSVLDFVGIETVSSQLDISEMTHIRMDIWTGDVEDIGIKLVDFGPNGVFDGGDDTEHEIRIVNHAKNQWVRLDIPLSDFPGLTSRNNFAQLILSGRPSGVGTLYIDNVYFRN